MKKDAILLYNPSPFLQYRIIARKVPARNRGLQASQVRGAGPGWAGDDGGYLLTSPGSFPILAIMIREGSYFTSEATARAYDTYIGVNLPYYWQAFHFAARTLAGLFGDGRVGPAPVAGRT
jgi:hypothetical protein